MQTMLKNCRKEHIILVASKPKLSVFTVGLSLGACAKLSSGAGGDRRISEKTP